MSGLSLDAGALIAVERGDGRVRQLLAEAADHGIDVHVVAGVVAQTWRGGPRQTLLARVLNSRGVEVPVLDGQTARAVGELCASTGHPDVVDVHVVLHARQHGHRVVTSDPEDLLKVDSSVQLIVL